ARIGRSRLPRSSCLARRRHAADRCTPAVTQRERFVDGKVSADCRRHYSHRTAAEDRRSAIVNRPSSIVEDRRWTLADRRSTNVRSAMPDAAKPVAELTLRGLILGALITTVFTAANVYLGLKVGLTFASSIPAAVISMAILSAVKDSTILENNIVQTVASAAGTLSAIIFVLPGLVIVGWWTGFPFWESFFICLSCGVRGVLFTVRSRGCGIKRLQPGLVIGAARCRTPGRSVGWYGDVGRAGDLVGDRCPDPYGNATRYGRSDTRCAHDCNLADAGALHRRRCDRGRRDLHTGKVVEACRWRIGEYASRFSRRGHW